MQCIFKKLAKCIEQEKNVKRDLGEETYVKRPMLSVEHGNNTKKTCVMRIRETRVMN